MRENTPRTPLVTRHFFDILFLLSLSNRGTVTAPSQPCKREVSRCRERVHGGLQSAGCLVQLVVADSEIDSKVARSLKSLARDIGDVGELEQPRSEFGTGVQTC